MSDTEDQDTWSVTEEGISVTLTRAPLDVAHVVKSVRSPKAGATVLFAGTTRDNFDGKPVRELRYSAYTPLALKTMLAISKSVKEKHGLTAVSITHRLGVCPIGEESILIAVSAPHRQEAWNAGQEALEVCKEKVEVWKYEDFGTEEGGVWRANQEQSIREPSKASEKKARSADPEQMP